MLIKARESPETIGVRGCHLAKRIILKHNLYVHDIFLLVRFGIGLNLRGQVPCL